MPSFYGENPPDTEVGSTDATESQVSEDAVTETDTSGGFYQGSPEQTTTEAYEEDARQAKEAAETAQTAAEAAQAAAEASESAASSSESNAASSQSAAATSATNASNSASAAAGSATTAATQASNAASSATAAAGSASNAASSESAAASSETAAASSQTAAAGSATAAASSAGTASTKASEAATSATNAAASESAAASSESNASTSASQAATSATNAASSESAAASSETNAASSASAASTSASNAASSASAASSSATAAASSASSASTSATAAGSARDAALAALDSFDDRYLGQKSSDPSLDNDGNALVAGALYFDTVNTVMKVYDGSQWLAAYASVSGALLAINNLNDVSNTATARSNLGLGTASEQNVTYFATAAQGSLADSALQNGDNVSVLTNDSGYLTGNETITLTGDVSGSGTTSISVTIADDSHNHVISNVDGLQTALNAKQDASTALTTSNYSTTLDGRYYTETEVGTFFSGSSAITGYNKTNWDTAYGWGDHGVEGYLTGNQTITLTGDVSGSGTTSIAVTIADDSHNHVISNVDGLQSALDDLTPTSNDTFNGTYPLVWVASDVLYSSTFMTINGSTDTLTVPNISTSGAITSTGTSTFAGIRVNNSNTALSQGGGNSLRITTDSGYVEVGPKNGTYSHFSTDRGNFYFSQPVHFDGQIYNYNAGATDQPYWHAGNDGSGSGLDADTVDGVHASQIMSKGTDIPGSANLNDYTTIGFYHQNANANASSGSNYPANAAGMLTVTADGNMVYQTYHQYNGNAYYHRSYYSGTWYPWRKVWTNGNDGSGSGLDADLLDGAQSSSFLRSDVADTFGAQLSSANNVPIRFVAPNATDTNDGKIGAGIFGSGLNIVGAQTTTGQGRVIRLWGSLITDQGHTYWHSANDGSGSGLDADLLDGQQASAFEPANATILHQGSDIGNQDWNTFIDGTEASWNTVLNHSGSNRPSSAYTYGTALSFSKSGQAKLQIYAPETSSGGGTSAGMWYRTGWNTGYRAWQRIWDSGNHGSGSGLDADLLDGIEATDFLRSDVSDVYAGRVLQFGTAGNGQNTGGAFLTIEGNTHTDGEGSGRLFFREHNSTTSSADNYGMSLGYRGGLTSVTTAMGNSWTGLASIGNGEWGMWGHDNNATGALIMHGPRNGSYVDFAGGIRLGGNGENELKLLSTSLINGVSTNVTQLEGRQIDLYAYDKINLRTGGSATDTIHFTAVGLERMEIGSGYVNVKSANLQIDGTTVINASRGAILSGDSSITGGRLTITDNNDALRIRATTNGAGANIAFSDASASSFSQSGYLAYYHSDGQSYGSGNSFTFTSTESTLTVLADGKLMFKEGLYVKPSSGTGAGTQIVDASRNLVNIGTISATGLTVDGGQNTTVDIKSNNDGKSLLRLMGDSQGTGQLYVGQSTGYGGGIEYNGDNSPSTTGAGADYIALYRRSNNTESWTARNYVNNADWEFRGNVTAYASDARLKENVTTITDALEKVQRLRGVEFDWKDGCAEIGFMPSLKHETGVIAQEVQAVIPDAAYPAPFDNDYLTVQKDKIVPLLIEAIKEQQTQIEELKALIKEIKNGDH